MLKYIRTKVVMMLTGMETATTKVGFMFRRNRIRDCDCQQSSVDNIVVTRPMTRSI